MIQRNFSAREGIVNAVSEKTFGSFVAQKVFEIIIITFERVSMQPSKKAEKAQ